MKRRLLALLAAGVPAALALAPGSDAARRPPARMLIYAQEWSLWASRPALPAGRVIVALWNRGQDAHDLRIRRLDGRGQLAGPAQGVAVTVSGARSQAQWHLTAGRYELYCSLPGHRHRGMHTVVTVN
jgi:hypothetical protein